MDWFTRKFAYIWLVSVEQTVNFIVFVYASIFRKRRQTPIKKIGTYWYGTVDQPGSNLRMGGWQFYFNADGFVYENYSINKLSEYVKYVDKGTPTKRYLYFSLCLIRRLPQILKSHRYDCIWIDRGIIPFYPKKNAFLEKQMRKIVQKLVVDTTDGGDYMANPELMEDTLKQAHEITVGYKYLKEMYSDRFKVTQVFYTIPTNQYIIKEDYDLKSPIVIGWMGSPGNFKYVLEIIPELQKLALKHNFVLRYICRENYDDQFVGINIEHHYFDDDYYKILGTFDIGISPFLKFDLRSKGKIAMKHQEFLLMGIPQVCSNVAISEFVVNNEHVLIAENKDDWSDRIETLILKKELREKLGKNSKILFNEYYLYENQYQKLKTVLTEQ